MDSSWEKITSVPGLSQTYWHPPQEVLSLCLERSLRRRGKEGESPCADIGRVWENRGGSDVQRRKKEFVYLAMQDPGRTRQNNKVRAGTKCSQPPSNIYFPLSMLCEESGRSTMLSLGSKKQWNKKLRGRECELVGESSCSVQWPPSPQPPAPACFHYSPGTCACGRKRGSV